MRWSKCPLDCVIALKISCDEDESAEDASILSVARLVFDPLPELPRRFFAPAGLEPETGRHACDHLAILLRQCQVICLLFRDIMHFTNH